MDPNKITRNKENHSKS